QCRSCISSFDSNASHCPPLPREQSRLRFFQNPDDLVFDFSMDDSRAERSLLPAVDREGEPSRGGRRRRASAGSRVHLESATNSVSAISILSPGSLSERRGAYGPGKIFASRATRWYPPQ